MKNEHFRHTFWYICGVTAVILLYVILITFFSIPKENQRFVDIALAFLLGLMSGLSAYLIGGNPSTQRKPIEGTTTADINISTTTTEEVKKEETI